MLKVIRPTLLVLTFVQRPKNAGNLIPKLCAKVNAMFFVFGKKVAYTNKNSLKLTLLVLSPFLGYFFVKMS